MHPSSMENMRRMRDKYVSGRGRMLDVGGRGLHSDRSYLTLFGGWDYHIADIEAGIGVTDVMPGPYTLPFPDGHFDLVVSGQMLEHCANPFRSVAEMVRVMKKGALIILIAPSAGPRHDKQDGWRFMDDAFKFIADEVGLTVVEDYIDTTAADERSKKWRDHVFVGRKP